MNTSKTSYPIRIQPNPKRTSFNFLQNINQILQQHSLNLNTSITSFKFQHHFSSTRILNGPQSDLKTVVIIRTITHQLPDSSSNYYFYMSIHLIDFSHTSLPFKTLIQQIQPLNSRVRDVTVSPNGKQLLIIYQQKIRKYIFENKQNNHSKKKLQYYLKYQHQINLTSQLLTNDINYHPTGQFIIGVTGYYNNTNLILKPFKLNPSTLQFIYGDNIANKCINTTNKFYEYLRKWFIAIDKNQYQHAMISGSMDTVCILDVYQMKIDYFNINNQSNITYTIIPRYNTTSTQQINLHNSISSIAYLNSSSDNGYFITIQSFSTLADRIRIDNNNNNNNNNNTTIKDIFNIFNIDSNKDQYMVKCIDIYDINAFACIKNGGLDVVLTKLNQMKQQTFSIIIKNKRKQKVIVINDTTQTPLLTATKNQITQQLYYDKKSGQICQLFDLSIECYQIQTLCNNNNSWTSINTCNNICKQNNINNYWNPITMNCQICSNCRCQYKQSFNPYYGNCKLNCSKIPFAITGSQYGNNTRCACQDTYIWNSEQKICRYNCSRIPFTDLKSDMKNVGYNQCLCLDKYKYLKQQKICVSSSNIEIYQTSVKSDRISGWGIFLIIVLTVFLMGIIIVIIKRCIKKKKQTKDPQIQGIEQLPQISSREKIKKENKSQNELKQTNEKICNICNNNQIQVNCSGPCGHFFHFSCMKDKIDIGHNLCPTCQYVFTKGLIDLKFVQKQEEIWSISER